MKSLKTFFFFLIICVVFTGAQAQDKFFTRNGHASFFSKAPLENIEAHNEQVLSIINTKNGEIVINMLMKSFEFEKSLMQEHFNENYVESHKYPKATFKGKITNFKEINFAKDGQYSAQVSGKMTIHGVTRPISAQGNIEVKDQKINAQSKFIIALKDYGIQVPKIVAQNVAENIDIKVDFNYVPYKK